MSDLYLFRNALKDLLRARKLGAALLLVALPTVLAALWRASARDFQPDVAYNTLEAGLVFGFTLVLLSVVFGTGVIAQEIEQKTIVYLLTRPIPRWRLLLIKFLAAVVTTTVTVWVASVLVALVAYGPKGLDPGASRLGRDLLILPVGALAYTALFLLLATLLNRPLTYGLLFAFGWESWVPNMPGNFQKLSLMAYLRILAPHPQPEAETLDLSQLLSAFNPQTITSALAWKVMAGVIVVALAGALLIFSTNEYVPREDAE
jgi:ABC-2 type transport system permease protein